MNQNSGSLNLPNLLHLFISVSWWSRLCVEDNKERLLQEEISVAENSPSTCITACKEAGYKLAGVQSATYCFCGNTPPPSSVIRPDNECDKECPGSPDELCGGGWRMNVFNT